MRFEFKFKYRPLFTRFKDRKEIQAGDHYRIRQEDDVTCSLTIMEAFPDDAGAYMAQLTNAAGTSSSEALLKVIRTYFEVCFFLKPAFRRKQFPEKICCLFFSKNCKKKRKVEQHWYLLKRTWQTQMKIINRLKTESIIARKKIITYIWCKFLTYISLVFGNAHQAY